MTSKFTTRGAIALLLLALLGTAFWTLTAGYSPDAELNRSALYYAENTAAETGAQNIVTAIIVTYRGLDTLGEVTVLFLSAIAVGLLLTLGGGTDAAEPPKRASEIVETAVEYLFPIVILLGVYIFANIVLSLIQSVIQLRIKNKDEGPTDANVGKVGAGRDKAKAK